MPYSNMPEHLWEKMDSCVEKVEAQGKSKESAIAICYDSLMGRSISANHEGERMNSLQQLWVNIKNAFTDAGLIEETTDAAPPARSRAVPAHMIMSQITDALRELNQAALRVNEHGVVELDWNVYLNLFDVYYDDGNLFAVVTRGGKLFRIPIAVADDVVTLGELVEIPLTRSTTQSQFRVIRTADGKRKWFAIACSSVLNRVNEIDSKKLFDSFVEHATRTGEYPVLSFYHAADVIRWGVATMIARDGDLYIAAGDWFDTPEAQRAADTFERSEKNWGTSIGYSSTKPPEWLELARDVRIPVFEEGVNGEISIVLENEAAAYLTAFGTREVTVQKTDLAYRRLVETFGEEEAERQLAAVNGAQRVIEETNPIRRAQENAAEAAPTPDAAADKPTAENAAETTAPAQTQSPATETAVEYTATPAQTNAQARELVLDDEALAQLMKFFLAQPDVQRAMSQDDMKAMHEKMGKMQTMLDDMMGKLDGAMERARKQEERLALLERNDAEKQRAWLADLPAPQRVNVVVRPREKRAQSAEPAETLEVAAQGTLSKMKSRQN